MLVDKLRLAIAAQKHAEIVKPGDHALQLYPVDQENRYRNLRLPDVIEKSVLQILFVAGHFVFAFVIGLVARLPDTRSLSPSIPSDEQSM